MPIAKGEPWGTPGRLPADAPIAASDADLAAQVEREHAAGRHWLGAVASGDLLRTLGGTEYGEGAPMRPDSQRLPIDLAHVRLDEGPWLPFVAHVVARRRFWMGEAAAVMNAAWLGTWYLGPRSHPNDGLLDITVGSLSWQDRLEARRRAPMGTHLPHPGLSTKRVANWTFEFARPTPVLVDGVVVGAARALSARVTADAGTVVV